jgi:hypothetical protein
VDRIFYMESCVFVTFLLYDTLPIVTKANETVGEELYECTFLCFLINIRLDEILINVTFSFIYVTIKYAHANS